VNYFFGQWAVLLGKPNERGKVKKQCNKFGGYYMNQSRKDSNQVMLVLGHGRILGTFFKEKPIGFAKCSERSPAS
jgi:hypothetical protein